jgi:hypothetical protein
MEENQQEQTDKFQALVKEVGQVFQKYNPPVEMAITTIFHIVSDVAQRTRIPKENLTQALSQIYDDVERIASEIKEESTQDEIQH